MIHVIHLIPAEVGSAYNDTHYQRFAHLGFHCSASVSIV